MAASASTAKVPRTGKDLQGPKFAVAVTNRPERSWKEDREHQLVEALESWTGLISAWDPSAELSKQLREMSSLEERYSMVGDILGMKAPATLKKRFKALSRFMDWLADRDLRFPPEESLCYRYLLQQKEAGVSASSRKGFIEVLTFCRHVLGVKELEPVVNSKRCYGNALSNLPREKRRASPLTVEELTKLQRGSWNIMMMMPSMTGTACFVEQFCWQCTREADGQISCTVSESFTTLTKRAVLFSWSARWEFTRP